MLVLATFVLIIIAGIKTKIKLNIKQLKKVLYINYLIYF